MSLAEEPTLRVEVLDCERFIVKRCHEMFAGHPFAVEVKLTRIRFTFGSHEEVRVSVQTRPV